MAKRKWSKGIKLKEGSLKALGYPDVGTLKAAVTSGKVGYSTLMSKLAFIANMGNSVAKRVMSSLKGWRQRTKKKG